ncbi:MAG: VOC family protein [Trueperaceae bacterium]
MELGAFSVSLAVKDLAASKQFYEKLGFKTMHGDESDKWVILHSGATVIGLFQAMFEKNILTFNPGWDQNAQTLGKFSDVRQIQASLDEAGVAITTRTEPDGTGIGHIVLKDPDGNVIMFDQHVPSG